LLNGILVWLHVHVHVSETFNFL